MSEELLRLLEQTSAARLLGWKKLAIAFTGNEADADDVLQDAYQRTLTADPPLTTEDELHYYMKTVIRTSAFKLLESRKRLIPGEDVGSSQADARPNALDLVTGAADAAEIDRLAARALELIETLPAEQKTLVDDLLLRDRPLKFREVSARDGVPLSTLHKRFMNVLSRIAQEILSEVPDPEAVLRLIREGLEE